MFAKPEWNSMGILWLSKERNVGKQQDTLSYLAVW
jgi:hypothetical protein